MKISGSSNEIIGKICGCLETSCYYLGGKSINEKYIENIRVILDEIIRQKKSKEGWPKEVRGQFMWRSHAEYNLN